VIGSGVRTGSNTVFVAPVRVGDGAYSGAGTIIRQDVPAGALAVTVAKQRNAEGWVAANRPGSVSAAAVETAAAAAPTSSTTPAPTEEG
jgi:bifunctional UDP-N-acetylglucosamine pyrophosphorylase/glucosamine-1-phosphate N-acetyltransferase